MKEASLTGVVDAGTVEEVGGALVLDLPLPYPKPSIYPAIIDLYNIYKIKNIRHMLTK